MKKIISLLICFILIFNTLSAFASVLGSSVIDGYTVPVGKGVTFTHRIYMSDQSGVGAQTENYITYSKSDDVTPFISFGTSLYGMTKISDETSRLSNEVNLTAGINADYFSLQTGVPMSNLISDGKIITKDASGQDTIGIMEDGTTFISYVTFSSFIEKEDGTMINIYNINKYRQPYAAYLLTEDFSSETHAEGTGFNVVLGSVDGEMRLGESLFATVESVTKDDGSVKIPKGKMVLTVDENAPEEFSLPISELKEGDKLKISFGAIGEDTRWNKVKTAMGSIGGRLLIDGEINPNLEQGAAPRTAIGITKDNGIILYTIDGRQPGYSYGVQLKTLAQRMKELGCIDALNLDGGGSTSIVSILPGEGVPTLRNNPSDGRERKVSTFFYLKNNLNPTKKLGILTFYPLTAYVLTGAKMKFNLKAADTNFHPISLPKNIKYSVVTKGADSEINSDGTFLAKDSGTIKIKAESGDTEAFMEVVCLATPTDIILKNQKGETLEKVFVNEGGEFVFSAEAYGGYNRLVAENTDFKWSASENIGTIDEKGTFTAKRHINEKGTVSVSAGDKTVSIPVTVSYIPDLKNPDSYPKLALSVDEDNRTLTLECATPLGLITNKEDVVIKADGMELDFEFDEKTYTATCPYPFGTSRISAYVKNTASLSAFAFKNLESTEEKTPVFEDAKGHWAEDVLTSMYEMGIINGEKTKDGLLFRPQKQMNRSEFAVMICNYLKLDASEYEKIELPFEDVEEIPIWALNATKALYSLEISKGKTTEDGKLIAHPLSPVTRAEAATIITRTFNRKFYLVEKTFTDSADIAPWAKEGINTLVTLSAMNGYTDGSLLPLGFLTKAEAAKLLYSII